MTKGRHGPGLLGVGVAACAACCAGPILGFLAALGLGALSVAVLGLTGLAIALLAVVPIRGRPRPPADSTPVEPVPVTLGRRAE